MSVNPKNNSSKLGNKIEASAYEYDVNIGRVIEEVKRHNNHSQSTIRLFFGLKQECNFAVFRNIRDLFRKYTSCVDKCLWIVDTLITYLTNFNKKNP